MWNRKELKQKGKAAFLANYWKTVLVAILMTALVLGSVSYSSSTVRHKLDNPGQTAETPVDVSVQNDQILVNGERVVNEMLADITGLSLTLDLAKKTENFDYDAMFRAYARFYQCIYRDRKVMTDVFADEVHPVPYSRVNYVVAQFDEFYKTYPSVKEGTPMYIAPEQRELIW